MSVSSRSQRDSGSSGRVAEDQKQIPSLRFPWIIAAGFLLATGLLAVVIGMAYRETKQQIRSSEAVLHSRDVISAISDYGNVLKSASTSAMNFYTSGTESEVHNFEVAAQSTQAAVAHLREMTSDDPAQQQLAGDLFISNNQALDLLRQVMDMHRQGVSGTKPLEDLTKSSRGMTANLNKTYAAMSTEENNRLKDLSSQQAAASRKALRLELWGGVFAGLLMMAMLALFMRESAARLEAQKQLASANADLEQRVRDRMAELQYVNQLLMNENAERVAAEGNVRLLNSRLEQ